MVIWDEHLLHTNLSVKLNFMHRTTSRVALILAWTHAFALYVFDHCKNSSHNTVNSINIVGFMSMLSSSGTHGAQSDLPLESFKPS